MGTLKAQGNLQFNQTLLLSTTQASNVLLGTVPAGKVWKVEGFGSGNSGASECLSFWECICWRYCLSVQQFHQHFLVAFRYHGLFP
jgi:hypothetical protein